MHIEVGPGHPLKETAQGGPSMAYTGTPLDNTHHRTIVVSPRCKVSQNTPGLHLFWLKLSCQNPGEGVSQDLPAWHTSAPLTTPRYSQYGIPLTPLHKLYPLWLWAHPVWSTLGPLNLCPLQFSPSHQDCPSAEWPRDSSLHLLPL